jgi:hypothetical protein
MRRLAVAGGISLAGAMSWLTLAFGHMINHPHLDAIVFYLPFLPVVFGMIALRAETLAARIWPRRPAPGLPAETAPDAGLALVHVGVAR